MCAQALTDSQRRLVEENIRLATHVAKRFTNVLKCTGLDFDDLFSLACLGLCYGARLYNPALSKASYLYKCCENAILQELRKRRNRNQQARIVSMDASAWFLDTEATLGDILEDPDADVENEAIAHMALAHVLGEATERELMILKLYAIGMNQTEIAPIVGISQCHVSRILAKMRKRANEALTESDGRECNASRSGIDCRTESAG